MLTPTVETIRILYEQIKAAELSSADRNIGDLLDFIRRKKAELQQAESGLMWLLRNGGVTHSLFIGPAIEQLSREAAEASLAEARESIKA